MGVSSATRLYCLVFPSSTKRNQTKQEQPGLVEGYLIRFRLLILPIKYAAMDAAQHVKTQQRTIGKKHDVANHPPFQNPNTHMHSAVTRHSGNKFHQNLVSVAHGGSSVRVAETAPAVAVEAHAVLDEGGFAIDPDSLGGGGGVPKGCARMKGWGHGLMNDFSWQGVSVTCFVKLPDLYIRRTSCRVVSWSVSERTLMTGVA